MNRDSFYAPGPTEMIQTNQSKMWLPCLACYLRKPHYKLEPTFSPCTLCPPPPTLVLLPCGPAQRDMSLLSGSLSNKLCLQWKSSFDLLASPYLNNNKTDFIRQGSKVTKNKDAKVRDGFEANQGKLEISHKSGECGKGLTKVELIQI